MDLVYWFYYNQQRHQLTLNSYRIRFWQSEYWWQAVQAQKIPPASKDGSSEISESAIQEISAPINLKNKKPKKEKAKVSFRHTPQHTYPWTVTPESDDTDVTIEEVQGSKVGWNPEKVTWAFQLWTPQPAFDKEKPVWKWTCKYCLWVFRTIYIWRISYLTVYHS